MKKAQQLGMNPSTASHRLIKDLLYYYGVDQTDTVCFHCGKFMSREEFSIEHKTPWLDSDNPVGLYFDLENVTFSHLSCNSGARRRELSRHGVKSRYNAGCRCALCVVADKEHSAKRYTPEKRRERYLRTGS